MKKVEDEYFKLKALIRQKEREKSKLSAEIDVLNDVIDDLDRLITENGAKHIYERFEYEEQE